MITSRGEGGPVNLAGLAQSNSVMFLISTLGAGLITTGMVYARDKRNYDQFLKVNYTIMAVVLFLQALFSVPPLAHLLFGTIMGLPASIEHPARLTFLASLPLQMAFFLRTPYQVVLYNHHATVKASLPTFLRIGLTLLLAPLFCAAHWVGPIWAVVCLTLPVLLEAAISRRFALPYLYKMENPVDKIELIPAKKLYYFNFPLSLGGLFLSLSGMIMGAVIARAADPERMLPVYYLAAGLVGPISLGLSRLQAVSIAFAPDSKEGRQTFRFAVIVGLAGAFLPLFFILPGLSDLYYVKLQNLSPADLPLIRQTALCLYFLPVLVALRSRIEGIAAASKNPVAILTGQAVFLGCLSTVAFVALSVSTPGNLIGPICLILSNGAAIGVVYLAIRWNFQDKLPLTRNTNLTQTLE
ncbi:MAG: hypothetical protein A2293_02605 [Elusimicrobia bacterium RIFOXYB2_FULL_49_7]|nr:MAG: hypothetical protein A2293_02605 [Elusimicrobia bacterium RIFOXYB2_FULL_49_7]